MKIQRKYFYINISWDWRWFGLEISWNGYDNYFNLKLLFLDINVYVGRGY